MKIKDLKRLLKGVPEDLNVQICDCADHFLNIVGGGERVGDAIVLHVRQEFPDSWYKDGEEIIWVHGKAVVPMIEPDEVFDLSLTNSGIFDDKEEHILQFQFFDGYAICNDDDSITIVYPKLSELTDDQIEEIDDYIGGRASDSGRITPGDVCLKYGAIRRRQFVVETVIWRDCDLRTDCTVCRSKNEANELREREWEKLIKKFVDDQQIHTAWTGRDNVNFMIWDDVNGSNNGHAYVRIHDVFV